MTTRQPRPAAGSRPMMPPGSRPPLPTSPALCLREPPASSTPVAPRAACSPRFASKDSQPSPDSIRRRAARPRVAIGALRPMSDRSPRRRRTCRNSIASSQPRAGTCLRHSRVLRSGSRAADAGGCLYLETPDATRYDDYLYAPFQEFNTEHINHFSARLSKTPPAALASSRCSWNRNNPDRSRYSLPSRFRPLRRQRPNRDERMAICDRELPARITSYIGHSAEQMEQINRHLAAQLTKNQSVILWGAGQLAMKLLALPALAHTPVRALVDNKPDPPGKDAGGRTDHWSASNRSARSRTAGHRRHARPHYYRDPTPCRGNQFPDSKPRTRKSNSLAASTCKPGGPPMKLSDYLIGQLADWGVRHIFLVTGGGAMHLNDSIGKEARIQFVCNHHEQASAMAAEAYARVSGLPAWSTSPPDRAASTRSTGSSGRGPTPFDAGRLRPGQA